MSCDNLVGNSLIVLHIKHQIKSLFSVQIESLFSSAALYMFSIYGARHLTLADFGIFSLLITIYYLIYNFTVVTLGESILIKYENESIDNHQPITQLYWISLIWLVSFIISISFLLNFFNPSLLEICLFGFSTYNLAILHNNRYFFHAKFQESKSLEISFNLFIISFTLLLITHIFMKVIITPYILFLILGTSAFIQNIFNSTIFKWSHIHNFTFTYNSDNKFIYKSLFLNLLLWSSTNLHWLIIGIYISPETLGIIKGIFTLLTPVSIVERAITINLYKNLKIHNSFHQVQRSSLIGLSIYILVFAILFINRNQIIKMTIGDQYLEYSNLILILFFIPTLNLLTGLSHSYLKYNSKFKDLSLISIVRTVVLSLLILNINLKYNLNILAMVLIISSLINCLIVMWKAVHLKTRII